jgi:hypothetical protein
VARNTPKNYSSLSKHLRRSNSIPQRQPHLCLSTPSLPRQLSSNNYNNPYSPYRLLSTRKKPNFGLSRASAVSIAGRIFDFQRFPSDIPSPSYFQQNCARFLLHDRPNASLNVKGCRRYRDCIEAGSGVVLLLELSSLSPNLPPGSIPS